MLSLAAASVNAFSATPSSRTTPITMKAAAAPAPSVWADPIAGHVSEVSMKDIAWDPLGLASEDNLVQYREAELKHGRLAMLAALGWPAAEEFEPLLAKALGKGDELVETGGRAPSLLNGGLEESQIPFFLIGVAVSAGLADSYGTKIQAANKWEPGNVGFDPLGLFPTDKETQEKFKLAELKHGRVAMLAIFAYALEEGISGTSILKETVPLEQEIQRLALEGPIQGNIDLVKDLTGDAKALLSDMDKEEKFYENALGFKGFSRPPVKILWPTPQ